MAKGKGFFKSRAGKNIMNIIYGVGAAIVILGALFKILHLTGAREMLMVGMGVEAGVFLISAFDFPSDEYEWEKVYPQLGDPNFIPSNDYQQQALPKLNFDTEAFDGLSGTLIGLKDSVSKFNGVADAANLTNGYADAIKGATGKIESLNQSYGVAVESMGKFANAASDAKAYHEQVQQVTKNLGSLNSVYELELQDAKTHLKSLNQFYGAMTQAMGNMVEASKDADAYKQGMQQLNANIQKLNNVYGNMLSAMAGGVK